MNAGELPPLVLLPLAFALGAAVGSFLNVVIHRVPRQLSVVSPPSHCPACDAPIRWRQNVPIVSWLTLRGRCAACGTRISARYLTVELLTGLLAVALARRYGVSFEFVSGFVFAAGLIALTWIDLDHRLLPDRITLPGIVAGLALAPLRSHGAPLDGLSAAALGVLVGGGSLWLVAWLYERMTGREGMGGGDIKLLAMIGAFLGWQGVLLSLFLGSVVGSVIGVGIMIARGADTRLALPFGPFLAIGALTTLLQGEALIAWYVGTLG